MTFLVVCKQKKNLDTFEGVIAALAALGHRVVLTIQERDAARDDRLTASFAHANISIVSGPDDRSDDWRASAPLVRTARDWAQYLRPPYASATKLAARAAGRLARELGVSSELVAPPAVLTAEAAARVGAAFDRMEQAIPPDRLYDEFLAAHAPDVVIVTPGLHFGSGQADVMKSARARGIPTWMLLFSWDNLSTKGALHIHPDLMFVWNERQRREAVELHGFPAARVVVAGAPRFDAFFSLRRSVGREDFYRPLGLDGGRPTLLYLCSSRFIAEDEPAFIRTWLAALRESSEPLRSCNVVVRPHPDVPFEPTVAAETVTWRQLPQVTGWVQRPFGDEGAVVLRTTYRTQEAFFECLSHAEAVVALNTSAELEAGIAGRPVFTVLATDRAADGQAHTLHFNYLLREQGGFVTYAADMRTHVSQLEAALTTDRREGEIQQFVRDFLRPLGDQPVAPLLARLLAESAQSARPSQVAPSVARLEPAASPAPEAAASATGPDGDAGDVRAPRLIRLTIDSPASVFATPETRRWRRDGVAVLSPAVRGWLETQVRPGDTVFEVGAGVGFYAIFAAIHRGCTVVAFEPGFAAFKALCDNVVHNGCGRRVMPLAIAVGPRPGLYELEYSHDAGSDLHVLTDRAWRPARDGSDAGYVQPVCAESLDGLASRFHLPPPEALRVAVRRQPERVLDGASALLSSPRLRTIACSLRSPDQAAAVGERVLRFGFTPGPASADGDHGLTLTFSRPAMASGGSGSFLRRLGSRLGGGGSQP